MTRLQLMHLETLAWQMDKYAKMARKLKNFPAHGEFRDKWELCRKCKAIEAALERYRKAGVPTVDLRDSAVEWVKED